MAKGLTEPPVNPLYALQNVVPKKEQVENTNNNNNPTTNTDNNSNNNFNTKNSTNSITNTEINNNNNSSSNNSTNISTKYSTSTNTVIIKEKVKYTDKKIQRAYWLDSDLVKIFDKNFPAKKYDKSEIINQLLRNFLAENNLI